MTSVDQLISDLCDPATGLLLSVDPAQRRVLFQAVLSSLLMEDDSSSSAVHHDLVPIDTPVYQGRNEKTGNLTITFPSGNRSARGPEWRELDITPAAMKSIFCILTEAMFGLQVEADTQPKPEDFQ